MNNDIDDLRQQFPQLKRTIRGQPLLYLDNAATTLKPLDMIQALNSYYSNDVANIHRGAHYLGDQGTSFYESSRETVRSFINAESRDEIVFTRGTTEGLNLLANTFSSFPWNSEDEILISAMEHHSNIVPWQLLAQKRNLKLKAIPVTDRGELDLDGLRKKLNHKVRVLSLTQVSNALGTINPVEEIIQICKQWNIVTVIDAAQSIALGLVDVQKMDCDFLVFSGHKIFAPNGVGVLYGKKKLFSQLPPFQGGGSMIRNVTIEESSYLDLPHRFEAGTPPIAEVIGLGCALEFLKKQNLVKIHENEKKLTQIVLDFIRSQKNFRLVGQTNQRAPIVSFLISGTHPNDVGHLLDQQGIAVRTGHHCCQPLMNRFGITGTVRVSFSIYNTEHEAHSFLKALDKVQRLLL